MSKKPFRLVSFFRAVRSIKKEFQIGPIKRGNDRSRRRICILVVDEFLKAKGDIDQAFFLTANLYCNLKGYHLSCYPTPEEVRLGELSRKKGISLRGFNPLKLVSEKIEPEHEKPYPLVGIIIKILTEEKGVDNGIPTNSKRRPTPGTFEHLQEDPRFFEEQKKLSFY